MKNIVFVLGAIAPSTYFTILGLFANFIGSLFLLWATKLKYPKLGCGCVELDVPDEEEVKKLKNWYAIGFWCLACGFLLQIFGVVVKK